MVTLIFYKNLSDRRVLNKNIAEITTIDNVLFLDDTSVTNPRFDLVLSADIISEINYCYCENLKRYFYIDNIAPSAGGHYIINCSVDVLKTYREQILKIPALIYTQTSNTNSLLANSLIPQQANEQIQNLMFSPSEFKITNISNNFVLTSYKGGT